MKLLREGERCAERPAALDDTGLYIGLNYSGHAAGTGRADGLGLARRRFMAAP